MSFTIQHFLPQHASSWCLRKLTRITAPWFKNRLIKYFAKIFKINWDDAAVTDIQQFKDFNDFFTRALKEGVRPIANSVMISPADGKIACAGQLDGIQFIRAKGHDFDLASLLADPDLAKRFNQGVYTTIYLSPRDYHRIHMPMAGKLSKMIHIPGKLYSVSLKTAIAIPTLFAQNERLVCVFESELGPFILVLVGAINVSSIETVWAGEITPPYGKVIHYIDYSDGCILEKGAEMGRFNMGSTVIVIAQNSQLILDSNVIEDAMIQMGAPLMSVS